MKAGSPSLIARAIAFSASALFAPGGAHAQDYPTKPITLIVPFAFDQSDNAEHARRLGTSRTLYRNNYRASRVFKELPMEFALEAQQLLGISLEGSVG